MVCRLVFFCLLLAALPGLARAQAVPSAAEPSRVGRQIAPLAVPTPSGAAPVEAAPPAVNAPEGAEEIRFTLTKLSIEGMTVYTPAEIEPLYHSLLGREISLADVYAIAARLTAKYRNDGYILSQAFLPPQEIAGGAVKIAVVEGFVDKVTVTGGPQRNRAFLESFGDKIRAARPLNAKTLERYVLLMNDLPGISARAVLSASEKTPGAADVTLIVGRKPADLFLQADNRGSEFIGPFQLNGGARLNGWLGLYEGIDLQGAIAPQDDEMRFGGVTWRQPLNSEGTVVSLGGSVTSTAPGFTLAPFDVSGIARAVNLGLTHPFLRSRSRNLYGTAKFDYLNSYRHDNLGLGTVRDRLRVLRLGGSFQTTDRFAGSNMLSAEASKGIDLFNASDKGSPNVTRPQGDPGFFKLTGSASRLQHVAGPIEVFAAVTGQRSADTLLASEEFGVGGAGFGSAYDSSEITGEDGIAGRLELRASNFIATPLQLFQVYAFWDAGKVWDRDNAILRDRERSLASAGGGLRAALNGSLDGSLELAKPLTRDVSTQGDRELRLFGALSLRY
jgi:hemolysin activation/secretion protein